MGHLWRLNGGCVCQSLSRPWLPVQTDLLSSLLQTCPRLESAWGQARVPQTPG